MSRNHAPMLEPETTLGSIMHENSFRQAALGVGQGLLWSAAAIAAAVIGLSAMGM